MNTAIVNRRGHGSRALPQFEEELKKENDEQQRLEEEKKVTTINHFNSKIRSKILNNINFLCRREILNMQLFV
jgi:hypothetical protein